MTLRIIQSRSREDTPGKPLVNSTSSGKKQESTLYIPASRYQILWLIFLLAELPGE